jgi:DNA-binding MarR family transcriptional regulator
MDCMTQRLRDKVKDVAIIKVLDYIAFEPGATASDIDSFAQSKHLRSTGLLLPEMVQAGLIERQEKPTYHHAKPYSITNKGRQYLEEARQGALGGVSDDKQGVLADVLRQLPEFQTSSEERIQEVSCKLVEAIGRHTQHTARRDAERPSR